MSHASRSALIDCTKGLACAAIIWHHLAFYGPMSDIAHPAAPDLSPQIAELQALRGSLGGFQAQPPAPPAAGPTT